MIWVLLAFSIFFCACGFTLLPLFTNAATGECNLEFQRQLDKRTTLVEDLRELELDLELGKIDKIQYNELRIDRERRLAALLSN